MNSSNTTETSPQAADQGPVTSESQDADNGFDSLGLATALTRAVAEQGYTQPTPIQSKAIPRVLDGRDLLAAAQTGTGKTAAFVLPILQRLAFVGAAKPNHIRALVLTPTRELASQVAESVEMYGKHLSLNSAVIFGGVKQGPQVKALRKGVDLLVATPGRLLDLHQQGAIDFSAVEVLVLDEADRMLDMGFIHDIRKIVDRLPKSRQTLMFSATFSKDIRALASRYLTDPESVEVARANSTTELVQQTVYPVDRGAKAELLVQLINVGEWRQVLVFTRTKHGANRLCKRLLKEGIEAAPIHGNKSQNARQKALSDFKAGRIDVLVATDIAARGLDIDQLPEVVNFDLPSVAEDYVHRIGRTGRAGATGRSHSLVSADEADQLRAIERLIARQIPRECIDGFGAQAALASFKSASRPGQGQARGRTGNSGGKQAPGANRGNGGAAAADGRRDGAPSRSRRRRRKPSGAAAGQGQPRSPRASAG